MYLLDASVLITAHSLYYPVDRVPEYWEWLRHVASAGSVKMPLEVFEEVTEGPENEKDLVYAWLQEEATQKALLLDAEVETDLVRRITTEGYAADLTDDEVEQIGRDPFLIAHGMRGGHCIVTAEVSKPSKRRQNRRVPDVCDSFGVQWCDPHRFNRDLRFSTSWKREFGVL